MDHPKPPRLQLKKIIFNIMKKKKLPKLETVKLLLECNLVKIGEEMNSQIFFEIGNEITYDVAEAVAILMRLDNLNQKIWDTEIKIDYDLISPRRALYWLSGGNDEWMTLYNYNREWNSCDFEFEREFGFVVMSVLKSSSTLGKIREGFIRHLNIPKFYEFGLKKGFID